MTSSTRFYVQLKNRHYTVYSGPLLNDVLQSAFDAANHLCGRNMWFCTHEKLAGVTGGEAMFEDSDAIGFGGGLQEGEPLIVCH